MNTTSTQLRSDTALSQTKGRKAQLPLYPLVCLPISRYWHSKPFFNTVVTSQSAQFRPISNCHAKHWWTKQERSYDLPPQSNVSYVNHRWTKLPSSVLQIMKPPDSIFLLLVIVGANILFSLKSQHIETLIFCLCLHFLFSLYKKMHLAEKRHQ